jgi:hypothetical protein
MEKKLLFWFGVFLLADGILSWYFGNSCLNSCANNNLLGNAVRGLRAGIGFYLIYKNR